MILALAIVLALGLGLAAGWWLPPNGRRPQRERAPAVRHILLPFTGAAISRRALEAAIRLARAEDAVIMPAFLARVPRDLPLDAPLPAACTTGMSVLEAIEQRAAAQGVPVDARVSRGRTYRDALRRLLATDRFDRVIVSATSNPRTGLGTRDLEWLLEGVDAEVLILRPAADDDRRISATVVSGHF